ncbi:MAG: hypothetical protein HC895_01370 [Leptolyngbyaceae cyanobacterium SM1_3_5]|nr:hypothetical protein [Leptolyngbyaceae cyanobacterium SM1_3_5]
MVDSDVPQTEVPQLFRGSRWDTALTSAAIGVVGGIAIGFAFASNNLAKSFTLAATAAGAGGAVAYFATDDRATSRRNELQAQIRQLIDERQAQQREFDKLTTDRQSLHQQVMQLEQRLKHQAEQGAIDLAGAKSNIDTLTQRLKTALQAQSEAVEKAVERESQFATLQAEIGQLQRDRTELSDRIEDLIEAAELEVQQRVNQEKEKRLKILRETEIKQMCQEYDALADRLFGMFERLERWGAKVKESHDSKSQIIGGLASEYNENLGKFRLRTETEAEEYIREIELLRERLARALAEGRGEILQVQTKNFGYSPEGAIANEIAVWIGSKLNIPLAVKGFHLKESGVIEAGYSYSASVDPAAIVAAITQARELCARNLGIHKIESVKKLEITDCLSIAFRRERPAARSEKGSLYRSKEDFMKLLMSSRLFFRFVGSPGKGKTPTVMVVLSQLLKRGFLSGNVPEGKKLDYTAIDFCNSLEGISVKNTDETTIFHRWSDPKQALKDLKAEYEFRRQPENKAYKDNVGYIFVCDEFDNAIADMKPAELKIFMKMLKDGGHTNMGAIVMGQTVMASTSNFKIEDQKFLLNVLLDSTAIRTFLEEYGIKFYAPKAIEIALATLEQIEAEIEETNEYICDTARQLRVAMVVAERSPVFYQLPYFDGVEIDRQTYADTRSQIQEIRAGRLVNLASPVELDEAETTVESSVLSEMDAARRLPMSVPATAGDRPSCPHCGSSKVRSKGDKWLCEDSGHSDRAAGKPKSWSKS